MKKAIIIAPNANHENFLDELNQELELLNNMSFNVQYSTCHDSINHEILYSALIIIDE